MNIRMENVKADTYQGDVCENICQMVDGSQATILTDESCKAYVLTQEETEISQFENCKSAEECKNHGNGTYLPWEEISKKVDNYKQVLNGNEYTVKITPWLPCFDTELDQIIEEPKDKRHFCFFAKSYDGKTKEYIPDNLSGGYYGSSDIYAKTLKEALSIMLDSMINMIICLNDREYANIQLGRVNLEDFEDKDMLIFADGYACGLYNHKRGEWYQDNGGDELGTPYMPEYNQLMWGVKKTKNDTLEYYRFFEDKESPKGFKCELAQIDYFTNVHEYAVFDELIPNLE
jgi:hypothetical protein